MNLPSIKFNFAGTVCKCCMSNTTKNEYTIVYSEKHKEFRAHPPQTFEEKMEDIERTFAQLESHLGHHFGVGLNDIDVELSKEKLPNMEEVEAVEHAAKKIFRERSSDSIGSPPKAKRNVSQIPYE